MKKIISLITELGMNVIIIFNDKGEILLQKRSMTKDLFPGMLGVSVGGHVNKGESYEEAAKRETEEELGVQLDLKFIKTFINRTDVETEMIGLFTATANGPFKMDTIEIESLHFYPPSELKRLHDQMTPALIMDLKQLEILDSELSSG
jgi:isopentenyldiphosphate isomerase